MNTIIEQPRAAAKRYKVALLLAFITIAYNLLEGFVSTYFGFEDESVTLFGFGIDSFIEVVSGIGIAHMVIRIGRQPTSVRDQAERTALRVTGFAFFALAVALVSVSAFNVWTGHKPEATNWGVIISVVSILIMWVLINEKLKVGRKLNSPAILADAECTRICIYMSIVLLASSAIYELTRFSYADTMGALGLVYFSITEGRECFEKAKSDSHCGCADD